jgi:hypothetical protein
MSKANTKRTIEYIGEILPDGHLSIPDEVRKQLELYKPNNLKVTITVNSPDEQRGWDALMQLIDNAGSSGLSDVSENHDKYLYGKSK